MKKAWDGIFKISNDSVMEQFNRSLGFDIRLFEEDVLGSKAYALALKKAGIITSSECNKIRKALDEIAKDIFVGNAEFNSSDEDIHMAIERLLAEKVGDAGLKIHTGRSRNDQVATDTRLYVKKSAKSICTYIYELQKELLEVSKKNKEIILPGYTHLQHAQPVSLAHYFLSFFFSLSRDMERFIRVFNASDVLVLGSGAIAGSGFEIDRKLLAKELGFSKISDNSMDAISDRDFVIEFISAAAILIMHISRYAEDMIIWSSKEFGFIQLSDAYSTGSSMMPQKRNPDSLELMRGKTGRVYGNLMRLLTVMKGVPLTYAKDMQEDKEALFDTSDTVKIVLQIMSGVIRSVKINKDRMYSVLSEELLATDIADMLVEEGLPFREAHKVVGKMTRYCIDKNKGYSKLTQKEIQKFSKLLNIKKIKSISFESSLKKRGIAGGTGLKSVSAQIKKATEMLKEIKK